MNKTFIISQEADCEQLFGNFKLQKGQPQKPTKKQFAKELLWCRRNALEKLKILKII